MATRQDVIQLLRDFRAFHTPYGGAAAMGEGANMADAAYGPSGLILRGQDHELGSGGLAALADSYYKLGHALRLLQGEDTRGMAAYLVLLHPYLGNPGDPSVVHIWHRDGDNRWGWHEYAIDRLYHYLRRHDLFVPQPSLMSEKEEKAVESQNAEILAVYERSRVAGMRKAEAIRVAAELCRVGTDTVYRILDIRGEVNPDECADPQCDRAPFSQMLCMKHYQAQRRARERAKT